MNLIYSCVFFQESYIELISILLKSFVIFGNQSEDTDYLIVCSSDFQERIANLFETLGIDGKIWCLEATTMFEAAYTRLKIFNYPQIERYQKLLYLDCDILVTDSVDKVFDLQKQDQLYVLQEQFHRWNHCWFFRESEMHSVCHDDVFTSGIILFPNSETIKKLFNHILGHIKFHIQNNFQIPYCLDQPFIVYHAITQQLYNNVSLATVAINNPSRFERKSICHFPTSVGHSQSKRQLMYEYFKYYISSLKTQNICVRNVEITNKYTWENDDSYITFLEKGNMDAFGKGKYQFVNEALVVAEFGNRTHILKFNPTFSTFISIRRDDLYVVKGSVIRQEDESDCII
tara:strand:- start:4341 stop:5375 length:1035 start_codon:yes stop_codon:yes gene_type:complete